MDWGYLGLGIRVKGLGHIEIVEGSCPEFLAEFGAEFCAGFVFCSSALCNFHLF